MGGTLTMTIEPLYVNTPRIWRGHFGVFKKGIYDEIKSKVEEYPKEKLRSRELNNHSFSTAKINEYRPHQLEALVPFYRQLYADILQLHFQFFNAVTPGPQKMEPVFDTGFYSIADEYSPDEFVDKLNKDPDWARDVYKKLFLIERSWFNLSYSEGQVSPHNHSGIVSYVCAYYVKVPINGGRFLVRTRNPNRIEGDWKDDMIPIEVKSGDYLIFPGDLVHGSEPNESNEERMVITTNIVLKHY